MNAVENRYKVGLYLALETDIPNLSAHHGSLLEAAAYGGTTGKELYKFENVNFTNVLDLTDPSTIQKLGVNNAQMMLIEGENIFEYTTEVAIWAKDNGYEGIKYFGVRGNGQTYKNVAIFEEYVNTGIPTSGVPEPW